MASDDHTTAFTRLPPGGALDQRGNQAITVRSFIFLDNQNQGILGPCSNITEIGGVAMPMAPRRRQQLVVADNRQHVVS
jgi:hypothetical protein